MLFWARKLWLERGVAFNYTDGGQVTTTTSVVGRKDGVDLTRLTLLSSQTGL